MGQITKTQTFPYSFKTAGTGDRVAIGYSADQDKIGFELINPQDFYACQQLYAHFRFVHDGTQAGRNITSVFVTDDDFAPTYTKTQTVNFDGSSLTVDAKIDVSHLRNEFGTNIVVFKFDGKVSGTIKIIKLDMLYQVVGIR